MNDYYKTLNLTPWFLVLGSLCMLSVSAAVHVITSVWLTRTCIWSLGQPKCVSSHNVLVAYTTILLNSELTKLIFCARRL